MPSVGSFWNNNIHRICQRQDQQCKLEKGEEKEPKKIKEFIALHQLFSSVKGIWFCGTHCSAHAVILLSLFHTDWLTVFFCTSVDIRMSKSWMWCLLKLNKAGAVEFPGCFVGVQMQERVTERVGLLSKEWVQLPSGWARAPCRLSQGSLRKRPVMLCPAMKTKRSHAALKLERVVRASLGYICITFIFVVSVSV